MFHFYISNLVFSAFLNIGHSFYYHVIQCKQIPHTNSRIIFKKEYLPKSIKYLRSYQFVDLIKNVHSITNLLELQIRYDSNVLWGISGDILRPFGNSCRISVLFYRSLLTIECTPVQDAFILFQRQVHYVHCYIIVMATYTNHISLIYF